jgi:glycosyltransferase involved in cell wall biosynthesis
VGESGIKVSVVIPAYNAGQTLDQTLASARGQTHRHLEIIVVDDGSTDDTAAVAATHVAEDPRVSVISQANAGVAAARNAGVAAARGEFIAPLDADDLWASSKIEQQLTVFAKGDPRVALVYTWFALLDAQSRVIKLGPEIGHEGDVLDPLAYYNFIGNGSSPLVRRAAIEEVGGFDTTLRARGGQGCEDWKLYFEIAERHHFAVVPEALTGYRHTPDNMSSDGLQMLRSRDLCIADLLPRHPTLENRFREGRNRLSRALFHRSIARRRFREAASLAAAIGRYDPAFLIRMLRKLPASTLIAMGARHASRRGSQDPGETGFQTPESVSRQSTFNWKALPPLSSGNLSPSDCADLLR